MVMKNIKQKILIDGTSQNLWKTKYNHLAKAFSIFILLPEAIKTRQ